MRVWLDRRLVIDAWGGGCCNESWAQVALTLNYSHDLIVDYAELRGSASVALSWRSPSIAKQVIPSSALYYRTPISGSPFTSVALTPGDPSPLTSVAYDSDAGVLGAGRTGGLSAAVAGVTASVLLRAADVFGNVATNATTNASLLTLALVGPDPSPTLALAWLGSGVYEANYTAVKAGAYSLSLLIGGVPVTGSPFAVTIAPGATYPTNCAPQGLPTTAVAGVTSTFLVQLRDAYGNNRTTTAADALQVSWVNGGTGVGYQGLTSSPAPGLFAAAFTPTVVGTYALTVILDTTTLSTSSVVVSAGALSPAASTASGPGLSGAIAGLPANVSVVARDQFGNRLTTSTSATFVFNVTGVGVGGVLVSAGGGVYNGSYVLAAVGVYSLAVAGAGGVAVQGSPFTVRVVTGAAASNASSLLPPLPTQATSGTALTFQVQGARLLHQPPHHRGGGCYRRPAVRQHRHGGCGERTWVRGVYAVTVVPTTAAACNLTVTLAGVNVSGSPLPLLVRPGPPTGLSTSSGLGRTQGSAGVPSTVGLVAIDAAGNAVASGGARHHPHRHPLQPLHPSAHCHHRRL